jgi:hypothetical protein
VKVLARTESSKEGNGGEILDGGETSGDIYGSNRQEVTKLLSLSFRDARVLPPSRSLHGWGTCFPLFARSKLGSVKMVKLSILRVQGKMCFKKRAGRDSETGRATNRPFFGPLDTRNGFASNQSHP